MGRIYEDHASSSVHPGVSEHESGSYQSAQSGDRVGMDATPGGSPRSSPPVAGDHRPIRDLADSKAPSVLCSSVRTQGSGGGCIPPALGQPPGVCLPSHSRHKESSSQTESLSPLRSHLIAPFWPQREWFPNLLELLSDIPVELPKRRDLLRQLSNARINRFSDGFFLLLPHLWNSLPSSVFPASFNLPSFKRQVYHHLRGQMA